MLHTRSRSNPVLPVKPKPQPSRFGFLSSAKTLVQSVWNRGKAPTNAAPSNIPKPASNIIKLDTPKGQEKKAGPPSLLPAKKGAPAPARPTAAVASGSGVPSIRVNNVKQKADQERGGLSATTTTRGSIASSSSRSRSPIPSFNTTSSKNSLQSNAASYVSGGTRTSRTSSMASPPSRAGSVMGTGTRTTRSRTSSNTNVSSMGNRLSTATRLSAQGTMGSMGVKKVMPGGSSSSVASRTSSRLSTTSSRLFAPTASSLAKTSRTSGTGLKSVSEDRSSQKALGSITNSPTVAASSGPSPAVPFSPKSGGIFSKPLLLPQQSGIPTPVKKRTLSGDTTNTAAEDGVSSPTKGPAPSSGTMTRARSLNGRKPRISRSKVIARLASQRAASTSSGSTSSGNTSSGSGVRLAPRASNGSGGAGKGKIRSSLGAKVSRASYGGAGMRRTSGGAGAGPGGLAMSAKKRARQSEYARRRSRVGPLNFGEESGGGKEMEVDV